MNDRATGAIEALVWVLATMERMKQLGSLYDEVREARDDLLRGVSIDFRERVRFYS